MDYGTGAIMAVPAHDDRDREFAERFDLPIKVVVADDGKLVDSAQFSGLPHEEAAKAIVDWLGEPRAWTACSELPPARLGLLSASATGAVRFRSSTATTAGSFPCRRKSCP